MEISRQQHEGGFKTPEEELEFLRREVARREKEISKQTDANQRERFTREAIVDYANKESKEVLAPERIMPPDSVAKMALDLAPEKHDTQMGELLRLLGEKGVHNTLSIVKKMKNPHLEDDFHRLLVSYLHHGYPVAGLKERSPLWKVLRMTLYEIALPEVGKDETERQKTLKELISSMEQFYAGMLSVAERDKRGNRYFALEIALPHAGEEVSFFVAVPDHRKDLFEKHMLSIFPHARIEERKDDYNIFNENGVSAGARAKFIKNPIFPIKTYDQFDYDPLNVVVNAFSKIADEGEGASLQLIFQPVGERYLRRYREALKEIEKGKPVKEAIRSTTITGQIAQSLKEFFSGSSTDKKDSQADQLHVDRNVVEAIQAKTASPIISANIRVVTSAANEERAKELLFEIESAFNQFENTQGNRIVFERKRRGSLSRLLHQFSFREFSKKEALPLSIRELTTVFHFPAHTVTSSPQLKQSKAGTAAAPLDMPKEGTLLGVNRYRNIETKVYIAQEDRLRHFYTIGQTGTGKTSLLKNMIAQDIKRGDGVCMIDPHGTDILDVLAIVPEERYEDVIYFDPSYTARPMALNMLEYDRRYPEQKTFVVNELFSIFQKLYGAIPESMGPIFEQYFRNATMLVIEDPETGSTLLDVSRVMADKRFRELKLSHCRNPVVVQFWKDIAEKAGGEAALQNIVPYITSKFDVFLANEIMRPIIAQEKSSFNFRKVMDERKILLVNLAKGRLGDINAHLIGLILVGKILMAALSRVDSPEHMPDFYLYLDEFQNVTTESIAIILSEARKYRLSLTVAHQFIAQLDERIKNAVFGNVGSIAAFRVGAEDAKFLENQFEPTFNAHDLMNLDNRNCYAKLLIGGRPAKAFNMETLPVAEGNPAQISELKELSYFKYGRDRAEVEQEISRRYAQE
jgi:tRNA isopentenyl-2-thiomethyl-A-37 hydroxylase MiaE